MTSRLLSISSITREECKVSSARKGINLPMLATGSKYDLKIVVGEKCRPTGMPSIQSTSGGKINYIFMISHYLDTVLCADQVGSSFFKASNDSNKLLVVDEIIDFGCREFPGVVSHWVH